MPETITLHSITPDELRGLLRQLIREEFEAINEEIQRVIGEDDLVSTGTACRILGVCSKVLKVLADRGEFTVYWHLKERRYVRGELLDYRNRFRANRNRG